jgi:hypothetical protein
MANRDIRKILAVGKSRAVTLPPSWCDYYELTDRDKVVVLYNSVLIIFPEKLSDKITASAGEQLKNLLECVPNTFILKPSIDLLAYLESEAEKHQLTVEQTVIKILRENLRKNKKSGA